MRALATGWEATRKPEKSNSVSGFNFSSRTVALLPPLAYPDFVHLLSRAWLVVSDSGGVQEEAPSLGKALLVSVDKSSKAVLGDNVACGA